MLMRQTAIIEHNAKYHVYEAARAVALAVQTAAAVELAKIQNHSFYSNGPEIVTISSVVDRAMRVCLIRIIRRNLCKR